MVRDARWPVSISIETRLGWYLTGSAAIAANLAQGIDLKVAVRNACRYVEAAICTAGDMGQGNGPINHFHSVIGR